MRLLFYTTSCRICFLKARCEAIKTQRWGHTKENRDFLQNKEQWPHERPTSNCSVILYRALVGPFIPRHVQLHRVFTARLWPCIRGRGFKESRQKGGGGNNPEKMHSKSPMWHWWPASACMACRWLSSQKCRVYLLNGGAPVKLTSPSFGR